ncbi:MAG: twin-arginine translocase subunit TatC [Deltaproteobacteria bacterium]|nr:twin-arginine translocase subunit TatC [Deltaproteobacteria bacterium]
MENRLHAVLDEVEKARTGLAVYAVVVVVLSAACFFISEEVLRFLVRLLGRKLVAYNPAEGFLALAHISIYCGIMLSLPVGAWLLWRGAVARWAPGWKGWGGPVILIATFLFISGVLLGYYVLLPAGIAFLVSFEGEKVSALISARKFISFCGTMLLALGLSFEAPLISFFLARLGWLSPGLFRKRWRHAILVCTILAAVITPTPDLYNMTLMTLPLLCLYFVSFGIVWLVDQTRGAAGERR